MGFHIDLVNLFKFNISMISHKNIVIQVDEIQSVLGQLNTYLAQYWSVNHACVHSIWCHACVNSHLAISWSPDLTPATFFPDLILMTVYSDWSKIWKKKPNLSHCFDWRGFTQESNRGLWSLRWQLACSWNWKFRKKCWLKMDNVTFFLSAYFCFILIAHNWNEYRNIYKFVYIFLRCTLCSDIFFLIYL